jgi:hypothetical protein
MVVRRRGIDATICGHRPGASGGDPRISSNRPRFAKSSIVRGRIFRRRSRTAQLRGSRDVGEYFALLPPVDLAWVVIGARPPPFVALRAHVKNCFRVVMTCQVSRSVGTHRAELDPHRPSDRAKLRTSTVVVGPVRRRNAFELTLVVLVRVARGIVCRGRGHCVTCNRLFRSAVRLGRSALLTQLYVGKRPISKRDRDSIRKFGVLAFRRHCSCGAPIIRVSRRSSMTTIPTRGWSVSRRHQTRASVELPTFGQNALMPLAEDPHALQKW